MTGRMAELFRLNREASDVASGFATIAAECHRLCGPPTARVPDGWPTSELALTEARHLIRWLAFGPAGMDLQPWNLGGCLHVSQAIHDAFGVPLVAGCFVEDTPEGVWHYAHYWNLLGDGRILDVTADQFDVCPGVLVTSATARRYVADCDCGGGA